MIVTLESTTKIVTLNGVPVRIWEGVTESGIECHAFITRIAVDKKESQTEFEIELRQCKAPSRDIESYPSRLIV